MVLSTVSNGCDNDESENSDEEEDWLMEQTLPEESEALLPTIGEYGFANQTKGVLHKFPVSSIPGFSYFRLRFLGPENPEIAKFSRYL